MWQRRFVALLVLVGIAFVVPSAAADSSLPALKQLPRPTRAVADAPAADAVLVQLKPDAAVPGTLAGRPVEGVGDVSTTGFVKVKADGDPAALAAELTGDPAVASATIDYPRQLFAQPNDPGFPDQSAYLNTIRMPAAWDRVTDASSQVIAIIDTGVDTGHPDLVGRLVPGYNAVNPGTPPTDEIGHGTMVAGIAAANTNNGIGVAGVAWNGRIMPIKVFTGNVAYDSDIAEGIYWAVGHGAKVINLSLGGPNDGVLLHQAIAHAVAHGVVVVAASGNSGDDVLQFPAAYDEVLAVGATDDAGRLTDFSSYGDWLDLAAPGFGIISTYPTVLGEYRIGYGTSFAAPMVSGAAALLRAQNPTFTTNQIAARLRASARDSGPPGIDPYFGYGVLDAARALGAPFAVDFPVPAMGAGEPNDVPGRATAITTSAAGTIGVEGDVDWYRYDEPTGGRTVAFTVTAPDWDANLAHNVDIVIEVYNTGLGRIAAADANASGAGETVSMRLPAGAYYVRVRNFNGGLDTRTYTLTVAASPPTMFAPPVFLSAQATYTSGFRNVAIGDVTGDGRDDLVVNSQTTAGMQQSSYALFVFAQQSDGSLQTPAAKYLPVQAVTDGFALLNVNQDGRLDVMLTGGDGVEVFRQTSGGVLVSDGLVPGVTTGNLTSIDAADIDGDGDEDVVVGGSPGGIWLLTHGAGAAFTVAPVSADFTFDVSAGDVDGDGRGDVAAVVYRHNVTQLAVYSNTVAGWVAADHDFASSGTWPGATEIGDVSGDGRADIVTIAGTVQVFRQNSDGSLAAAVTDGTWGGGVSGGVKTVAIGDVDGDGLADIVSSDQMDRVTVIRGTAGGGLAPGQDVPLPFGGTPAPQGVAIGDIDGDARNDIARTILVLRHASDAPPPADAQEFVRTAPVADLATGVPLNVAPQATFQVALDPTSVTADTVRLIDGRTGTDVPAARAYNAGTKTVTITPSSPLSDNKPYRVVVDGVRDPVGHAQLAPFTSTFSTVDTVPTALAGFAVQGLTGAVHMNWLRPGDLDQVIVRMAPGTTPPNSPTAGTAAYTGIDSDITIGGLTPGTTYSFAAFYKDRGGAISPARTATLFGTALSMEVTSGSSTVSTTSTSTLTFASTLTRVDPAGPVAGQAVELLVTCRGRLIDEPVATPTTTAGGAASADTQQILSNCSYRWVLRGSSQFMGASSATVEVTASIPMPPGGPPPRR